MDATSEILFMEPYFVPLIWGSESWGISAYRDASSIVSSGKFKGKSLRELWSTNRELFGNLELEEFPHLIKFIEAKRDLSVQVHPDDAYAQKVEGEPYGKKECWYVLDCEPKTTIIIGHKSKDRKSMKECIDKNEWNNILNEFEIHPGDFFQIDPGTIHAIKGGTKILETQQTSDLTYRLYDYGRLENGKPRELHIEKALDVIDYSNGLPSYKNYSACEDPKKLLYDCDKYKVYLLKVSGSQEYNFDVPFLNCSVIDGSGEIDGHKIKYEDNFILPYKYNKFELTGNVKLICSHV